MTIVPGLYKPGTIIHKIPIWEMLLLQRDPIICGDLPYFRF